jgi:signal transduction histidine kinase
MRDHPWVRPWLSVRVRVTALATVVVAAALAIAGFALVQVVEHQLVDKVRKQAEEQLSTAAQKLRAGVPPQQVTQSRADSVIVGVVAAGGQPVAGPPLALGNQQSLFVQGDIAPGQRGGGVVTAANGVGASGSGAFDIRYEGVATPGGTVTVVAASPLSGVEQSISTLKQNLWLALPAVVAVVAGIAWLITGRALRPVEAIRAEVEEISGSTIHRRVPEPATGDEVARLARTMNAMLDRLETAAQRQREFVSDASHELRSPVASMRTQLEVGLSESPDPYWSGVTASVLEDEARLEALIADLLLLATIDEASPRTGSAVDVAALVRDEARRPRDVAVRTTIQPDDEAFVIGIHSLLSRVLTNLLDNAARYARSDVRVGVHIDGEFVLIHVDDDGPGISPLDRERVFERFTRLDTARARGGDADGGAGLGLPLARGIVDRHHGTVMATDSPLGGARFEVRLPAVHAKTAGSPLTVVH